MGKAFTDEERALVQEKLRRTGLALFAEKGIRGVSIRDLTAAAGIAQGGFYTFYRDKEDFLADLIGLRVREKLAAYSGRRAESLADPAGYLAGLLYAEGMHLKENKAFDNMISGTIALFAGNRADIRKRVQPAYAEFLGGLADYWRSGGYEVSMDIDGFLNLILAAGIMFSNASLLEEAYFEKIFRQFCEAETALFLRVKKIDAK